MDRFQYLAALLRDACPPLALREQEPMTRHTTFRIGGPVALMALPCTQQEATIAVQVANTVGITPFFLGNGSNLLVADAGVAGFFIKTTAALASCQVMGTTLLAQSGITLTRLAVLARDAGLTGLEFAHGIPGCLGGGVGMNAGAYGGELSQVVGSVTCLSLAGVVEECTTFDFGYRHSAFADGQRMILGARLELQAGDRDTIRAQMEALSHQRQSKQPLEYPSAGSMFKRPPDQFAAALIDECGLKGLRVGGAQVSEKHAGFVVNRGGATCEDVLQLVEQVRQQVLQHCGVALEMEVKLLK